MRKHTNLSLKGLTFEFQPVWHPLDKFARKSHNREENASEIKDKSKCCAHKFHTFSSSQFVGVKLCRAAITITKQCAHPPPHTHTHMTATSIKSRIHLNHAYALLFIICIQHIKVDIDSCVSFVCTNHQCRFHTQFTSSWHLLFASTYGYAAHP